MAGSTGKTQRAQTASSASHSPDLSRYYRFKLPDIHPGAYEFHLDLLRPGKPAFPLDRMVQLLNWVDEQSVMTGSMTLYRPDMSDPRTLPVARGHRIRCRVKWGTHTYELWTMRVGPPQVQVDAGQVLLTLQDDLVLLEATKRDWIFRKTSRRPYGWTCDEIARSIASTLGMKVGQLAKGTYRMTVSLRNATALAALRQAYATDKKHSGRSFVIRRRNGALEVVVLQRNPLVYVLAGQIQSALITQKAGTATPTTILTGYGRVGHGSTSRKITYTEYDRKVIALLGAVRESKTYGSVNSMAELKGLVRRDLAKGLRVNDVATVTHQGIPFINRGDGIELYLPSEGYGGAQSFVYATRANHNVQAGIYTTDWDFTTADPFLGAIPASFTKPAAARRAKIRTKRKRTKLRRH